MAFYLLVPCLKYYMMAPRFLAPAWIINHLGLQICMSSCLLDILYWMSCTCHTLNFLYPLAPIVFILHTHYNLILTIFHTSVSGTPFHPFVQTQNPVLALPTYKCISQSCHLYLLNIPNLAVPCSLHCPLDKALHLLPALSFLRCHPASTKTF